MSEPINVFIIYAREDKEIKQRLLAHLNPLTDAFKLVLWHDDFIEPGQEWKPHIESRLEKTDVFLLLVSVDFMNSEFIHQVEFKFAIDRHKSNQSIVIPVITSYCQWDVDVHFKDYTFNLSELQALPHGGIPVDDWSTQAKALNDVAGGVRTVLTSIKNSRLQTAQEEEKKRTEEEAKKEALQQAEALRRKKEEEDRQRQQFIQQQEERQQQVDEEKRTVAATVKEQKTGNNTRFIWYSSVALLAFMVLGYSLFLSNSSDRYSENMKPADTATMMKADTFQASGTNTAIPPSETHNNPTPGNSSVIHSRGTITIHSPYAYDMDEGAKLPDPNSTGADFSWSHPTPMTFVLQPLQGELHVINRNSAFGKTKFNTINKAYLVKLPYSKQFISMDDIDKGVIVAVKTSEGRYCKFILLDGELDFTISWVTYE